MRGAAARSHREAGMDGDQIDPLPDLVAPALARPDPGGLAPVVAAAVEAAAMTAGKQIGAATMDADVHRKRLATLQAALARKGYELHPTADGIYIVCRWNLARSLKTLDDVKRIARQMGVSL